MYAPLSASSRLISSIKRKTSKLLLLSLVLLLSACREQIVHDLDETLASRHLAVLSSSGIAAEKIKQNDGKWGVSVESTEVMNAINALSRARLLKSSATSSIESTGLISSQEDQQFKFERSVSRELETTIVGIPGVLEARVHLNFPQRDVFLTNKPAESKGSGSVLVITDSGFKNNLAEIAQLVAGAAGIDKALITVLQSQNSTAPSIIPNAVVADINNGQATGWHIAESISATISKDGLRSGLCALLSLILLAVGVFLLRGKFSKRGRLLGELNTHDFSADII